MFNFYDRLFYGTFLFLEKDRCYQDQNIYQALSTVLCLMVSHFLFIFSLCILFFPDNSDFELETIFSLMLFIAFIFWFAFIRSGRYRTIFEKYQNQQREARRLGIVIHGVMIMTFFFMALREIIMAGQGSV